eukprot:gene15427-biopygen654
MVGRDTRCKARPTPCSHPYHLRARGARARRFASRFERREAVGIPWDFAPVAKSENRPPPLRAAQSVARGEPAASAPEAERITGNPRA